jgi:DNA-directed RNA polymerase subunit H (RpoH/RPB5)
MNISINLFRSNMRNTNDKNLKDKTLNKIRFLEDQLVSLDHYLPETYEYLMQELDLQKKNLAKIEIEDHFASIDENE